MTFPSIEAIIPFLSERGKVEVDLALAKWQFADLSTRHEEMSAALVALEAEKLEASAGDLPD
jgi:hypothetical protein